MSARDGFMFIGRAGAVAVDCPRCGTARPFLLRKIATGATLCLPCSVAQLKLRAVRLEHRARGPEHFAVVHRSTQIGQKPWQVSWFDPEGAWGHTCRDSVEECVEVARRDGYRVVEECTQ